MAELSEWSNFYVIVGSAAGGLIGLQFVVMTLISGISGARADAKATAAFATPSLVYFGAVLLLAAIISAPWHEMTTVASLWGLLGLCGFVYTALVTRRLLKQSVYRPVFEDWLFHSLLPFAAYALLAVSALGTLSGQAPGPYLAGAAALVLLFVGIHNAWDAVTYHIFVRNRKDTPQEPDH